MLRGGVVAVNKLLKIGGLALFGKNLIPETQ
jgi:hypothetical protein